MTDREPRSRSQPAGQNRWQSRRRWLALICVLGAAATSCTPPVADLRGVAARSRGEPIAVAGTTSLNRISYLDGLQLQAGRVALRNAAVTDPRVEAMIREHGAPDAIAVQDEGRRFILYYGADGEAYVFERKSTDRQESSSTRPFDGADLPRLARTDFSGATAGAIRVQESGELRLWSVGRRILAQVPPRAEAGAWTGFGFVRATSWALKALGLPSTSRGVVVTWVAPDGPAAGSLEFADLIVAVDGKPVACPEDFELPREVKPMRVSFQRRGTSHETTITPVPLPLRLTMTVAGFDGFYAGAQKQEHVVVSAALVDECDDDMLAYVLGHEIEHIAAKHREPGETNVGTTIARVMVMPIFLVPVVGPAADKGFESIENAYSRDQERDADQQAVRYAIAAGYDPGGALRVIDLWEKSTGEMPAIEAFASTHPSYDHRRESVREISAELDKSRAANQ